MTPDQETSWTMLVRVSYFPRNELFPRLPEANPVARVLGGNSDLPGMMVQPFWARKVAKHLQ